MAQVLVANFRKKLRTCKEIKRKNVEKLVYPQIPRSKTWQQETVIAIQIKRVVHKRKESTNNVFSWGKVEERQILRGPQERMQAMRTSRGWCDWVQENRYYYFKTVVVRRFCNITIIIEQKCFGLEYEDDSNKNSIIRGADFVDVSFWTFLASGNIILFSFFLFLFITRDWVSIAIHKPIP